MNFNAISEDFVQFVWKFNLFDSQDLVTTTGEKVQIIFPGEQNLAGGPDFFKAKIVLDDTLWVGTVEIHLTSKDWYRHKHQLDNAYNNVVLHVVFEGQGEPVLLQNGRKVPSVIIKDRVYPQTLNTYNHLQNRKAKFIPCQGLISQTDAFMFQHLYQVLSIERLERKVQEIEKDLSHTQGDLDAAFLMSLFKHFGSPLNKLQFEILSRSFTLKQLSKNAHSVTQLESFLFGLANLLHNQDEYAKKLANEFAYIQSLYQLDIHCNPSAWQFAGNRPSNFPTIRLAQLCALLFKIPRPLTVLLEKETLVEVYDILKIESSSYWNEHYSFGKKGKRRKNGLSKSFINKLIINVLVPFLFFYGQYTENEVLKDRALDFLEQLAPEKNQITKGYRKLGFPLANALESQALIQLKNEYCKAKRCLDCRLAYHLLKTKREST